MKKIAVMSDNHGRYTHIYGVYESETDCDYFIHCGDFVCDDDELKNFIAVKGNCDYSSKLPQRLIQKIEGLRILVIHGNQFGHNVHAQDIFDYMDQVNADICCFGHTHVPVFMERNGKYIVNPGSTSRPRGGNPPTYCVMTIDQGKVSVEFKNYE